MYLFKELMGRTTDLIHIFQLCNLLSNNFFPKPWSSLKQISWWPPWKRNWINYWFGQCSTSDHLIFKQSPEMIFKPLPEMKFKDTWVSLLSWRFVKQFQTKHLRNIWCLNLSFIWLNLVVLEHSASCIYHPVKNIRQLSMKPHPFRQVWSSLWRHLYLQLKFNISTR